MKKDIWIRLLLVVLIVFTCVDLFSQVVVERSENKVIISGIPYYIHLVKKEETPYSISKAYGITVEELTRENPPAVYGINPGQALRIPVEMVKDPSEPEPPYSPSVRDESRFIYHIIQPEETIYSLSRLYGVSENDILSSNPGIEANNLSLGAEIAVPRKEFMIDRQSFDIQEEEYIYHKVVKGESLSSIARRYGLTVRALRRENRNLRFPQVGDYVRIPGVKSEDIAEEVKVEPVADDDTLFMTEEVFPVIDRPADFVPVNNLNGSLNVAVLLPFYLEENSERTETDSSRIVQGNKIYEVISKDEDWMYPPSIDFIEMYQGILLAADTLSSLGLDVNIYAYDIKSDTVTVMNLINTGRLAGMDLIIGPVYSNNLSIVARYAGSLSIPVVSPVPLFNNDALTGNPLLYMASSSLEVAQIALSNKISNYYDNNIVFIHTDTAGRDREVLRFKDLLFNELNYRIPYNDIRFKEFFFYSKSAFDNDSIDRLSHALSDQMKNVVIIASEEQPVIGEIIQDLHTLSKKYDVTVFCYPVMRDMDNIDPKYFFDLDMQVYTPRWIDFSKDDILQFNSDYRKYFLTEPSPESYAWQGYDIAYFFLSGIAMYGNRFLENPVIHFPDLLQTEYIFLRKGESDGFENRNLFLVRYTNEYEVELIEEQDYSDPYK